MIPKSNEIESHDHADKTIKKLRHLSKISKSANSQRGRSMIESRNLMALQEALQDPVVIYEGS